VAAIVADQIMPVVPVALELLRLMATALAAADALFLGFRFLRPLIPAATYSVSRLSPQTVSRFRVSLLQFT
jgi:hypothetical protein